MIDVYEAVTKRIIAQLEQGVIPWRKDWIGVGGKNNRLAVSWAKSKPYSLLNQFLLGEPGEYITFNQCKKAGGKVKKGSESRMVVFWKMLEKPVLAQDGSAMRDAEGRPMVKQIPYLNYFNVFHIRDCEGIKSKQGDEEVPEMPNVVCPVDDAERVIAGYTGKYHIKLSHVRGDRAYYSPSSDSITLPEIEQFTSMPGYYSTVFHELTHSTGHASRLNRIEKTSRGSNAYAKEELVAEIGSATIMNELGFETEDSFENSVSYVQSWLKALRNDKKMIVSAAGRAEKAVKMILESLETVSSDGN